MKALPSLPFTSISTILQREYRERERERDLPLTRLVKEDEGGVYVRRREEVLSISFEAVSCIRGW